MSSELPLCAVCAAPARLLHGFTSAEEPDRGWWCECTTFDCLIAPMAASEAAACELWTRITTALRLADALAVAAPCELLYQDDGSYRARQWITVFRAYEAPGTTADAAIIALAAAIREAPDAA